jgi:hypothetical protein
MASGFTRPNERISNSAVKTLAGGIRPPGMGGAVTTDYAKTSKNIVQAAAGSKVKKT